MSLDNYFLGGLDNARGNYATVCICEHTCCVCYVGPTLARDAPTTSPPPHERVSIRAAGNPNREGVLGQVRNISSYPTS